MSISNIKFKDFEEVESLIENKKLNLVVYQNNVYDLTEFKKTHPGGDDILEDYTGYDIEEAFTSTKIHKHSQNAHNQMEQYKIGYITYEEEQVGGLKQEINIDEQQNQQNSDECLPIMRKNLLDYQSFRIYLNIPIASQVWQISGQEYKIMLDNPCRDEQVPYSFTGNEVGDKVFNSRWNFLKYQLLGFLILTIVFGKIDYSFSQAVGYFLFGMILWTFIDYWIQRLFVSSYRKVIENNFIRYIHFVLFGHHLLFPLKGHATGYSPLVYISIFSLFFLIFGFGLKTLSLCKIIVLGAYLVLIIQEYIHFKFHYGRFTGSYLSLRQNLHLEHHYKQFDSSFGIFIEIWDNIFKTKPTYLR